LNQLDRVEKMLEYLAFDRIQRNVGMCDADDRFYNMFDADFDEEELEIVWKNELLND